MAQNALLSSFLGSCVVYRETEGRKLKVNCIATERDTQSCPATLTATKQMETNGKAWTGTA